MPGIIERAPKPSAARSNVTLTLHLHFVIFTMQKSQRHEQDYFVLN